MNIEMFITYLNYGVAMLIIDIFYRRLGFEIKLSEYRKHFRENLVWGLLLLLLNSLSLLIGQQSIQTFLPNISPEVALMLLIIGYAFIVHVRVGKR